MSKKLLIAEPAAGAIGHFDTYLSGLAQGIARLGCEVIVHATPEFTLSHELGSIPIITSEPRRPPRTSTMLVDRLANGVALLRQQVEFARETARLAQHHDVSAVLYASIQGTVFAASVATGARPGCVRAAVVHRVKQHPVTRLSHSPLNAYNWILGKAWGFAANRPDVQLFCHGDSTYEDLREIAPDAGSRITRLPFPVRQYASALETSSARARLGIPPGRFVALMFGSIRANKNYALVFRALSRCPEAVLVVSGQRVNMAAGELERMAVEHGVASQVIVLEGHQPEEAIGDLFAAVDCSLAPYDAGYGGESGPVVIGCTMGVPAIVSDIPDLSTPVRAHNLGWVFAPGDADDLARQFDCAARETASMRALRVRDIRAWVQDRSYGPVAQSMASKLGLLNEGESR